MTENNGPVNMDKTGISDSVWLLQWFRRRLESNRNVIALFVGQTGSGKSYSAIRLAERVDPNFSVDRIVFTVEDFMALVNSDLPKGSVIIFDDAGLGINARLWQDLSARIFGMLTQGFRYKQINTFITVPDESFIERQSRKLVHIRFEATDVQGMMKMKLLSRNTFDPEHPLAKFPRIHRGIAEIVLKMVKFRLPTAELTRKYEEKKKEYMEAKFKEFEESLKIMAGSEITTKNGKPAIRLTCDNCGYEWNYTGRDRSPQCPRCHTRIYIAEIEEKKKRIGIPVRCPHCGYEWAYTRDGIRTKCPDCGQNVNINKNRTDRGDHEE